ncbi:protein png1 [Delphinella strobiligena]|nr:protein png1 [Delphinella strobiligena]
MQPSRRRPAVPEGLSETWAKDLTDQFRRLLSTKRMDALNRRSSANSAPDQMDASVPTAQSLPSYSSLRNLPLIPTAPSDRQSLKLRSILISMSQTPCRWENPGLLDEALRVIPLDSLYDAAQEESDLFLAEAASLGRHTKPAWGYQDCVVRALMRWFHKHFFTWINNPQCSKCNAPTIAMGMAAPVPDEQARGASRVELYQCSNAHCHAFERFPRYNDAFVLLQTRRGRVGEWATCFGMLARAVGSRVRWVWNSEDYIWTEVWSVHRKRWIHVDPVEALWDQPLIYTQGWKKRLGYCIAFSSDGAMDVTRRYVRNPAKHSHPRNKASEAALLHIMDEIRSMRRRDMNKTDKFRLEGEDMREDREFRQYMIENLAKEISRMLPGASRPNADIQKAVEQREADAQWLRTRGQTQDPNSNQPRDQRQQ